MNWNAVLRHAQTRGDLARLEELVDAGRQLLPPEMRTQADVGCRIAGINGWTDAQVFRLGVSMIADPNFLHVPQNRYH